MRRFDSAQTLIGAAIVSGVGYLIMAAAQGWQLAGPAFALVGFAVGVGAVVSDALRQRLTPPEVMGRVGAASRGIVWGAAPVGALVAGSPGRPRRPPVAPGAGRDRCSVSWRLLLARPLLHSLREAHAAVRVAGSTRHPGSTA